MTQKWWLSMSNFSQHSNSSLNLIKRISKKQTLPIFSASELGEYYYSSIVILSEWFCRNLNVASRFKKRLSLLRSA